MKAAHLLVSTLLTIGAACGGDKASPPAAGSGSAVAAVAAPPIDAAAVPAPWDWPAETRAATEALIAAMQAGQADALGARLAATVRVDLRDGRCGAAFAKPRRVSSSEHAALASCLVTLAKDRALTNVTAIDVAPRVYAALAPGALELTWTRSASAGWQVSRIFFLGEGGAAAPKPLEPDEAERAADQSALAARREAAEQVRVALRSGRADDVQRWLAPRVRFDVGGATCAGSPASGEATAGDLARLAACLASIVGGRDARVEEVKDDGPEASRFTVALDPAMYTFVLGGFEQHWRVVSFQARKKLEVVKETPRKIKVMETVQPLRVEDRPVEDPEEDRIDGEIFGAGDVGGVVGGVLEGPPPPPPPPRR